MKIYINGLELEKQATGEMEVGQVLSEIQSEIHADRKVLLQASMDGVPIEHSFRRRRQLSTPVTRVEKLELIVQNPDDVASQMLKDSVLIYQQLLQEVPMIATRFRMGDEYNANQQLAEAVDKLTLSLRGSSLALGKRAETDGLHGRFNTAGSELMPVIDKVLAAQASGDYTSLADQLEYRLPVALEKCFNVLVESETKLA